MQAILLLVLCLIALFLAPTPVWADATLPADMKMDASVGSTGTVNVLWSHGLTEEEIQEETRQVKQAWQAWQDSINARNSSAVAALYDSSALLYATFKTRLSTQREILSYFDALCAKDSLTVTVEVEDLRIFAHNVAINSGIYIFSYIQNGQVMSVNARYSFVYLREAAGILAGQWQIIDHHSSQDPEAQQLQESRKASLVKKLAELYSDL